MITPLTTIALYVRDMPKIADFYSRHFGFIATASETKEKITLTSPAGGCRLVLLQASKGHRVGQSCVKLVFEVSDVAAAKAEHLELGLRFGPIHRGANYQFSNARDPAKNLLQITARTLQSSRP